MTATDIGLLFFFMLSLYLSVYEKTGRDTFPEKITLRFQE